MTNRRFFFRLLLAASLVLAPVLSGAQMSAGHGESAAAHAAPAAAGHADHQTMHGTDVADMNAACAQHDHDTCQGQCCAACAHCFVAAVAVDASSLSLQPVRMPVVLQLFVSADPAFLNRPPQG